MVCSRGESLTHHIIQMISFVLVFAWIFSFIVITHEKPFDF